MAGELKAALVALTAKVAEEETVVGGVVVLLDGLKEQIDALAGQAEVSPDDLNALSAQIDAQKQKMADAVARDTTAAPSA